MKIEKPNRIDIIAAHHSSINEFVHQLMLLKVPTLAAEKFNIRSDVWNPVHLSNGGLYVAPVTRDVLTVKVDSFPKNLFVTSKQIGIAASIKAYAEMIDVFNQSKTGKEHVAVWIKTLEHTYHYLMQMTRDRSSVERILNTN